MQPISLCEYSPCEEVSNIVNAIVKSGIDIDVLIGRAPMEGNLGSMDTQNQNSSGDVQKKLDVISNEIMVSHLIDSNACSILISEENEEPIMVDKGDYIVAFDPLDGSSNIDCNCTIGTIFSISKDTFDDNFDLRVLKDGADMICSGYILYGTTTDFIIAYTDKGTHKYTLDRTRGEFVYIGRLDITDKKKRIYSINESSCENWYDDMKPYIGNYKVKDTPYTHRYIGSMVGDIHRTLTYGGMFSYPADKKNTKGKLRILYECLPFAKIVEEAGGEAITGSMSDKRMLDVIPLHIHDKTSILLGAKEEIARYRQVFQTILDESEYSPSNYSWVLQRKLK